MKCELTKKSFEVPALLERHNDFEQAICRTVFQDKYSSSVKTYHVIDHILLLEAKSSDSWASQAISRR